MTGNRLVPAARKLPRAQTSAEGKLWSILRNRQLEGLKFRRQHPIGSYVADFCCEEMALIVELDGGHHAKRELQDRVRTMTLEDMKYTVFRFWNVDVVEALDGVIDQILATAQAGAETKP